MPKLNGMCPICYLKELFTPKKRVTSVQYKDNYDNGVAMTPPMGWSSWNTFKNHINEELICDTARAMVDSGLVEAGYQYINMDDNWHSSLRTDDGKLQGDLSRFPSGIASLVERINGLGLKVGIYSSNGTETCEDLPASLGHELMDARSFADWGIEYFKYDYCHNKKISGYAPLIYSISIAKKGEIDSQELNCKQGKLVGAARFMTAGNIPGKYYVSGLDRARGKLEFDNVSVAEDGEYVLTINVRKHGSSYEKFVVAEVNDSDIYSYYLPWQKFWNVTARFQQVVRLHKGENKISFYNPIANRADSTMMQYHYMGECLKRATAEVATKRGTSAKPILYSICEWGRNEPYKWGRFAGNAWRTTPDITPTWMSILYIYEHNVKLHEYACRGGYNDPDMLEVGNGKLTENENIAHFALWCMMNAPLILGNDLRSITPEVLKIVTNRELIAINQDKLCKQAKRISKGKVDLLAKPLSGGQIAICAFNKVAGSAEDTFDINSILSDKYISEALLEEGLMKKAGEYILTDLLTGESMSSTGKVTVTVPAHSVKVYRVTAK